MGMNDVRLVQNVGYDWASLSLAKALDLESLEGRTMPGIRGGACGSLNAGATPVQVWADCEVAGLLAGCPASAQVE